MKNRGIIRVIPFLWPLQRSRVLCADHVGNALATRWRWLGRPRLRIENNGAKCEICGRLPGWLEGEVLPLNTTGRTKIRITGRKKLGPVT